MSGHRGTTRQPNGDSWIGRRGGDARRRGGDHGYFCVQGGEEEAKRAANTLRLAVAEEAHEARRVELTARQAYAHDLEKRLAELALKTPVAM